MPWESGPFNVRFIGAVYLASLTAVLVWLSSFRWAPGRVALAMLSVFAVLIVTGLALLARRYRTAPGPRL